MSIVGEAVTSTGNYGAEDLFKQLLDFSTLCAEFFFQSLVALSDLNRTGIRTPTKVSAHRVVEFKRCQ
jgi:hypothetical protein